MKHKIFEAWILSDLELDPKERKALYDHLIECSDCDRLEKNLRAAEHQLNAAGIVGPAPGFAGRFQARLEVQTRWTNNRQNLFMLLGTAFLAAFFLWLSGLQFLFSLDRVIGESLGSIVSLGGMTGRMGAALAAGSELAFDFPPMLPALLIMAGFAAAGAAVVLWMKMFRTFARSIGLTQWA